MLASIFFFRQLFSFLPNMKWTYFKYMGHIQRLCHLLFPFWHIWQCLRVQFGLVLQLMHFPMLTTCFSKIKNKNEKNCTRNLYTWYTCAVCIYHNAWQIKIKGKSQHHLFNGILKVNISTAFQKFVQSLFFKHWGWSEWKDTLEGQKLPQQFCPGTSHSFDSTQHSIVTWLPQL